MRIGRAGQPAVAAPALLAVTAAASPASQARRVGATRGDSRYAIMTLFPARSFDAVCAPNLISDQSLLVPQELPLALDDTVLSALSESN
jgi:hypothetical protein